MTIYERISKALRRKWSRFGCGPEKFQLNIHHWEQLGDWFFETRSYRPENYYLGKPIVFMGTKLILKARNENLQSQMP